MKRGRGWEEGVVAATAAHAAAAPAIPTPPASAPSVAAATATGPSSLSHLVVHTPHMRICVPATWSCAVSLPCLYLFPWSLACSFMLRVEHGYR